MAWKHSSIYQFLIIGILFIQKYSSTWVRSILLWCEYSSIRTPHTFPISKPLNSISRWIKIIYMCFKWNKNNGILEHNMQKQKWRQSPPKLTNYFCWLWSLILLLKYSNFGRYSIVILSYSSFEDVIPPFIDVLDVIGHVKFMR